MWLLCWTHGSRLHGVLSAQEKDDAVVLPRAMMAEAGVAADTAAAATSQLTEASQQNEDSPDPEQSVKKGS